MDKTCLIEICIFKNLDNIIGNPEKILENPRKSFEHLSKILRNPRRACSIRQSPPNGRWLWWSPIDDCGRIIGRDLPNRLLPVVITMTARNHMNDQLAHLLCVGLHATETSLPMVNFSALLSLAQHHQVTVRIWIEDATEELRSLCECIGVCWTDVACCS